MSVKHNNNKNGLMLQDRSAQSAVCVHRIARETAFCCQRARLKWIKLF